MGGHSGTRRWHCRGNSVDPCTPPWDCVAGVLDAGVLRGVEETTVAAVEFAEVTDKLTLLAVVVTLEVATVSSTGIPLPESSFDLLLAPEVGDAEADRLALSLVDERTLSIDLLRDLAGMVNLGGINRMK